MILVHMEVHSKYHLLMVDSIQIRSGVSPKSRKVENKLLQKDYHLVPVAVETFGGWDLEGVNLIRSIGKKIQENTGDRFGRSHFTYTSHLVNKFPYI